MNQTTFFIGAEPTSVEREKPTNPGTNDNIL
jgi:hypothetical protein